MEKTKYYYGTRFSSSVIQDAHDVFLSKIQSRKKTKKPITLSISNGHETWKLDSIEEFFGQYDKSESSTFHHILEECQFYFTNRQSNSVTVSVEFEKRDKIEAVFNVFERNVGSSRIASKSNPIKVFIGHGQNKQWKDLKDHLHEEHGLDVDAYEIGPRAGLSVKEVLEKMLADSSIAFLVLTGEDEHTDGELHARENVIHELGLFQGRVGFTRAIALLEDGVKEFSNILGINQIRFSKGNIRETFGDVVATIKREFENSD